MIYYNILLAMQQYKQQQQQIETTRFMDKQQRIRTETRSSTTTAHNNSSSSKRMLDTMNISTLAPHIINQRSCYFYMTSYDYDNNGYLNYTEYQTFLQNILTTNNEYYNEISECNDNDNNRIMLLLLTNQSYYIELSCLCELYMNETKIVEALALTTRSSTTNNDTAVSCCNRTDFDQNVLYLPDVHYITMNYNIVVCQHIAQTVHDTCNANQTIGPISSNSSNMNDNNTNITEQPPPTSDTNNTTDKVIVKSEHVLLRYMLPAFIICIGILITFIYLRYNYHRRRKRQKKADKAIAAAATGVGDTHSDDDSSSSSSSSPTCSSNKDATGEGTDLNDIDENQKQQNQPVQQHIQQYHSPITMCNMDLPIITTTTISIDVEDAASVVSSSSNSSDGSMKISFSQ